MHKTKSYASIVFAILFIAMILACSPVIFPKSSANQHILAEPLHTSFFHVASAGQAQSTNSSSSSTAVPYDEQIGETFTQSFSSLAYNVTAVVQSDSNGYGPVYLLNGLTSADYWYQIGLSYNWAETTGGYDPGFHANYNVFDSSTNVVFPTNGFGGIDVLSGSVNAGDTVELSLTFQGGNVIMSVHDWNTGASARESFSAEGSTQFIGLAAPSNSNGYFTGLMTEQYHSSPYYGGEKEVLYNNDTFLQSQAYLWIDEYNVNTGSPEFSSSSGLISFASNPSQLHFYSLQNATEAANANDLITGSGNTVAFTVSYSAPGGGSYLAPTFSYTSDGVPESVALSTSPTTYNLDIGSSWSVTNPLGGSNSSERWITNQTASGTAISQKVINFAYLHQYLVTISSSPTIDGSTNPSGSNWYNAGESYNIQATPAGSYFLASWTAPPTLAISNPSSSLTSVLISGPGTITANFATSSVSLSSQTGTITQGAFVRLFGIARAGGGSSTLGVSGLPSGASYSFAENPITLSPSGSGFSLTITTTFAVASGTFALTITSTAPSSSVSTIYDLTIKQAIPLNFSYSVTGSSGSSVPAPKLSYTYNGTSLVSALGTTPRVFYADQNSRWSVPPTISGSTQAERWGTNNVSSGSATSQESAQFEYFQQFLVKFDYSLLGGGSGYSTPTISATQFGSRVSPAPGESVWVDSGSQYSFSNPLSGGSNSERWQGDSHTTGVITNSSSSLTIAPVYYHQIKISAGFSVANGDLPNAGPNFNFSSLGITNSTHLGMNLTYYWVDAGSNYSIAASITGSPQERWITNSSQISGTATSSVSLDPLYVHQYFLTMVTGEKAGGNFSPQNSEWITSGDKVSISAVANSGWKFEYWEGSGQGSYSGNSNFTTIRMTSPIVENATFYAGLTISSTGGGTVFYSFGTTSGSVSSERVVYVPYGESVSIRSNPSSILYDLQSWRGVLSGSSTQETVTITTPSTVLGSFGYDLLNIAVIVAIIVGAVVVGTMVIVMRRRSALLPSPGQD